MKTFTNFIDNLISAYVSVHTIKLLLLSVFIFLVYKRFPIWIAESTPILITLHIWLGLIGMRLLYLMYKDYCFTWYDYKRHKIILSNIERFFDDGVLNERRLLMSYIINPDNLSTVTSYILNMNILRYSGVLDRLNAKISLSKAAVEFGEFHLKNDMQFKKDIKNRYKLKRVILGAFKIDGILDLLALLFMFVTIVMVCTILTSTMNLSTVVASGASTVYLFLLYTIHPFIIGRKDIIKQNKLMVKKSLDCLGQIVSFNTRIYNFVIVSKTEYFKLTNKDVYYSNIDDYMDNLLLFIYRCKSSNDNMTT